MLCYYFEFEGVKIEFKIVFLEFKNLSDLGRGRWKIEFDDYTMEYGYGYFIYDTVESEIEEIARFGYEKKQEPHGLVTNEDTIKDIKKIIQKNYWGTLKQDDQKPNLHIVFIKFCRCICSRSTS